MAITFTVQPGESGMRLDRFLAGRFAGRSRAALQALVVGGTVRVNGAVARKSRTLAAGDTVDADLDAVPAERAGLPQAEALPLDVLYEDRDLIAINKPAGLVVHPGSGNRTGTLVNALLHHTAELAAGFGSDRPGIVHRLDKDTSGVLLAARTDQAHAELARQFAGREVAKVYYGFCVGPEPPERGLIEAPIGRSRRDPARFSVRGAGKASATEYERIAWHSGIAFVRFRPRTGRTHQIRVHASHAGFPILADTLYGGGRDAVMTLEPLERPFAHAVLKCFARHALHAFSITVHHPRTGAPLTLTAPFPQDFRQAGALFGGAVASQIEQAGERKD